MWPAAMFIVGTAMQMYGQYSANQAQAKAENENANYYRMQENYAVLAEAREEDIFLNQMTIRRSEQEGAVSASGVDFSGSIMYVLASQGARDMQEFNAIQVKGKLDQTLARGRGDAAQRNADTLESSQYNLLQLGGTALNNSSSYANSSGR